MINLKNIAVMRRRRLIAQSDIILFVTDDGLSIGSSFLRPPEQVIGFRFNITAFIESAPEPIAAPDGLKMDRGLNADQNILKQGLSPAGRKIESAAEYNIPNRISRISARKAPGIKAVTDLNGRTEFSRP